VSRAFVGAVLAHPARFAPAEANLEILADAVVVDVDFSARVPHNTGIQRVARQTTSRWCDQHSVVPTAWWSVGSGMRRLSPDEFERVTRWGMGAAAVPPALVEASASFLIPFNCTIVVTEVPTRRACEALTAMAVTGANSISLIGYDVIPATSGQAVPLHESNKFVDYLGLVKRANRLAAISATAAQEFTGFVDALAAQGLRGPRIASVPLPVDVPSGVAEPHGALNGRPQVLCVGSQEPRKNQLAVLTAAETLWRKGREFDLTFIGESSAWFAQTFDGAVARLARRGRPVQVRRRIDDATLADAYSRAAFTVFPSLHEGFGLPVAESLAFGVPAITSDYGSTAEIGRDGGCLLVDPRDPRAIADAMEDLLTKPEVLERLTREIRERPVRTWDDYAEELWNELVVNADARETP
jgi:hypothetical protein